MILQPIIDIAEICFHLGADKTFISPGSRSAPLTLAFARHPGIECRVIPDERSAAFMAMGMAQQKGTPVVLICTSGSAAYNYAPAVAEAYFQRIPLLIFTADRPPEWVDQLDGQTIRQPNIYGSHVKKSFSLPVDLSHADSQWQVNRMVNEAVNLTVNDTPGPVHVNVPFREPFYPEQGEKWKYKANTRLICEIKGTVFLADEKLKLYRKRLKEFSKILVVAGQQGPDKNVIEQLHHFSDIFGVPVVSDVISNTQSLEGAIIHQDAFLGGLKNAKAKELQPQLLITFGLSVISKQLKKFLRNFPPAQHWHLAPYGEVADTFQHLTEVIRVEPHRFLKQVSETTGKVKAFSYLKEWQEIDRKAGNVIWENLLTTSWHEFKAISEVVKVLPNNSMLHLANSMAVRYLNYLGLTGRDISVFANRGTSGIDGSNSTAIGAALTTEKIVTLITGDVAFFYDRNAFWHSHLPANLRIVLVNNHGGGIFGLIDGPAKQPELKEYFVADQKSTARHLAQEFQLEYHYCENQKMLTSLLPDFFKKSKGAKILEVSTEQELNQKFFIHFKNKIKRL